LLLYLLIGNFLCKIFTLLNLLTMSRICYFTGKTTTIGNQRKHNYGGGWAFRAHRTTRTWKPNLRKLKIVEDGTPKTVYVSMKFYKKLKQSLTK